MRKLLLCSQEPLLIKELYGPIRDEGIEIDTVEYIADAVREFLVNRYDAVILDSRSIGLNAFEAASIMKTRFSPTPIFVLSGDSAEYPDTGDGLYVGSAPGEIDRFMMMFKEIMQNNRQVHI